MDLIHDRKPPVKQAASDMHIILLRTCINLLQPLSTLAPRSLELVLCNSLVSLRRPLLLRYPSYCTPQALHHIVAQEILMYINRVY